VSEAEKNQDFRASLVSIARKKKKKKIFEGSNLYSSGDLLPLSCSLYFKNFSLLNLVMGVFIKIANYLESISTYHFLSP
jgi:hypothetical protein